MNRILVATDGSEAARRAVDWAAQLALQVRCSLTLVHVVPIWQTPSEATVMPEYGPMMQAAWRKAGEKLLNDELQRLRAPGGLAVDTLLLEGHAARAIASAAEQTQADLVVIGSRGLGAVSRLLLGSTSSTLVHLCSRPTVVVP